MREKRGYFAAALPKLLEGPGAAQERRVALGELAHHGSVAGRQRLTVIFFESGLGIESVHLAGSADHKQKNDGLRLAGKVRWPGRQRVGPFRGTRGKVKQRSQRDGAEAVRG